MLFAFIILRVNDEVQGNKIEVKRLATEEDDNKEIELKTFAYSHDFLRKIFLKIEKNLK